MFQKLLRHTVRKNYFSDRDFFLKFEAEDQGFSKCLRLLEHLGERAEQFSKQNTFFTCSWRFFGSEFKSEKINGI